MGGDEKFLSPLLGMHNRYCVIKKENINLDFYYTFLSLASLLLKGFEFSIRLLNRVRSLKGRSHTQTGLKYSFTAVNKIQRCKCRELFKFSFGHQQGTKSMPRQSSSRWGNSINFQGKR